MSSNGIQFFMTPGEFVDWLGAITQLQVRFMRLTQDGFEEFPAPTNEVSVPDTFLIAAQSEAMPPMSEELPPGADWIRVFSPRLVAGRLYLGVIAPAQKNSSRKLLRRLRKSLRARAPLATIGTNTKTKKSSRYSDLWSTIGARDLASNGVDLCQEGVSNVRYRLE